jgi:phosphoribosylglycinamide formyltransferase-1
MYGMCVHEAVINNRDTESGITIHFVDEVYDNGEIIFQARCTIDPLETPESLAQKIHLLEHKFFPETIEHILSGI